ncbi:MAG: LysR substrate-binding domain-containing protein [Hyphomicrobiaceae bacterium]
MARDLDISLLRAFTAVVETGSVTAAARLLNRTQAAVSQQIKRLEDQLGAELFDRGHKRVSLAPPGERLLAHATRLVALNDETWGLMTTPHYRGEVRLGVPCDIVPTYGPAILRRFGAAWPEVRVSLSTGDSAELLAELDHGEIDLTLTTELKPISRHGEMLRRDRLVWVTGPGSDAHRRDPLPLAIGAPTCRFRPVVLDALRRAGRDWRFVLEVASQEAANATVFAGLAVNATLSASVAPGLEIIGSEQGLPELEEFGINLYLPPTGGSELANELARHIRADFAARFGELPGRQEVRAA